MAEAPGVVIEMRQVDLVGTYSIYNAITIIGIVALIYWFIRPRIINHLAHKYKKCDSYYEGMESKKKQTGKFTDENYRFGPLDKATYGDETIYIYDSFDEPFANEWRTPDNIYIPNSKTYWMDTNMPKEVSYWATGKLPFKKRTNYIDMID
jgi:hypothetical protein